MKIPTKSKMLVCCVLVTLTAACSKVSFNPVENNSLINPQKSVSSSEVVAFGNKQVDFLLVLDDSNSMLPDLKKLAARMSSFVTSLEASNIDWQMCLTTTRGTIVNGTLTYGSLVNWNNYSHTSSTPDHLLVKGTPDLNTVFTTTIENIPIGGSYSGDERGIKAAHDNFGSSSTSSCYRPGAALSIILISDEDERSVGGDPKRVKAKDASGSYQPLESSDLPATLVLQAASVFGDDVRLTFNSIIVKPGDTACEAEQDKDTSPSHPGYIYAEASQLTEGGVGSICDADYSSNLNTFKDKIVNSLTQLILSCTPVPNTLSVKVNGKAETDVKVDKKVLKFKRSLIEGTKIDLKYDCMD